jgi:hypothetical protein
LLTYSVIVYCSCNYCHRICCVFFITGIDVTDKYHIRVYYGFTADTLQQVAVSYVINTLIHLMYANACKFRNYAANFIAVVTLASGQLIPLSAAPEFARPAQLYKPTGLFCVAFRYCKSIHSSVDCQMALSFKSLLRITTHVCLVTPPKQFYHQP